MESVQPGSVITPQDPRQQSPAPASPSTTALSGEVSTPVAVAPQPQPSVTTIVSAAPTPVPQVASQPTPVPEANYTPAPINPVPVPSLATSQAEDPQWFNPSTPVSASKELPNAIQWTALEFIEHSKNAAWYSVFALGAFVVAALVYLITKDKISTGIVGMVLVGLGIYSARKPREQRYSLSTQGIQVGQRTHSYASFKTFSISAPEGQMASVVLMPLKRFSLPLTLSLDFNQEDAIVDYLAAFLPFEQHKPDAIESLLQRIHF